MRYSGTCGKRAGPTYSPWPNACHGIGPQAFQRGSPQPLPIAQSTPAIGGWHGLMQPGAQVGQPGPTANGPWAWAFAVINETERQRDRVTERKCECPISLSLL